MTRDEAVALWGIEKACRLYTQAIVKAAEDLAAMPEMVSVSGPDALRAFANSVQEAGEEKWGRE